MGLFDTDYHAKLLACMTVFWKFTFQVPKISFKPLSASGSEVGPYHKLKEEPFVVLDGSWLRALCGVNMSLEQLRKMSEELQEMEKSGALSFLFFPALFATNDVSPSVIILGQVNVIDERDANNILFSVASVLDVETRGRFVPNSAPFS